MRTIEQNFFRIDLFWEVLTAHFLTLSNSKYVALREAGTTSLSELIILTFQYMVKYYKLKPPEDEGIKQKITKPNITNVEINGPLAEDSKILDDK